MFLDFFQRLTVIENQPDYLVLQEQPLLDWLIALLLLVLGANIALFFQLWLSFVTAVVVVMIFVARTRTRIITFDAPNDLLTVAYRSFTERQVVLKKPLHEISRAYLRKDADGSTQIILVDVFGDEMGLSAHTQGTTPWKEPLVIAINAVLHEAHKNNPDGDGVI